VTGVFSAQEETLAITESAHKTDKSLFIIINSFHNFFFLTLTLYKNGKGCKLDKFIDFFY